MENIIKRIKAQFDPIYEISLERYQAVIPYLKLESYPPKHLVKKRSTVEVKARYMLKGYMGLYVHSEKGPICNNYYKRDQIACDFISYVTEKLTDRVLKTYEATEAVVFYKRDYQSVIEEVPEFATLALKLTEQEYKKRILWDDMIKGKLAKERVILFRHTDPEAWKLLPQKDAAQILNINAQVFSRILRELNTENLD